jgi:hypothetical protein
VLTKLRRQFIKAGIRPLLVVALCALAAPSSQGQIVTLVHNNSSAQINTGTANPTNAGMFNWNVDNVNQLKQQWFWFRVGSAGPEQLINSISAPTILQPDNRRANISYFNGAFGVEVDYLLTGASIGSHSSDISEAITITNATGSPLVFHFFQYSDFQLAGDPLHNIAQIAPDDSGKFDNAYLFKGPDAGNNSSLSETVVSPAADRAEVGLTPFTFGRLIDGNPTTLNNDTGPTAEGEATWAFEWDLVISPGSSTSISKDKYLHWQPIPEPSAAALVIFGLFGAVSLRRKKAAR